MTQSENENDHFDLDHFDHIFGKSTYNALWYWVNGGFNALKGRMPTCLTC